MQFGKYIWMNGTLRREKDATIPVMTHSLHYGSAVFEGIRFYETDRGRAIFRLRDHTNRFFFSAATMGMKLPYSKKEFEDAIAITVRKNGIREGYIRPIAFYGLGMGLHPASKNGQVAIGVLSWDKYFAHPLRVMVSRVHRFDSRMVVISAKVSGYYANSFLAVLDASRAGYDEALLLDAAGNIAEGPGQNFFLVKKNALLTPALGAILPGITRASIMKIARDLGYAVVEKKISLRELKNTDEAFFSGTATGIAPVVQIDRLRLHHGKPGPVTMQLAEAYAAAVRGKTKSYLRWLTFVDQIM